MCNGLINLTKKEIQMLPITGSNDLKLEILQDFNTKRAGKDGVSILKLPFSQLENSIKLQVKKIFNDKIEKIEWDNKITSSSTDHKIHFNYYYQGNKNEGYVSITLNKQGIEISVFI